MSDSVDWLPSSTETAKAKEMGIELTIRTDTRDYKDEIYCMAWYQPPGDAPREGCYVGSWQDVIYLADELESRAAEFLALTIAEKSHPGFKIQCRACLCEAVIVSSNVGYSPESGSWGGVSLECLGCHESEEIWRP